MKKEPIIAISDGSKGKYETYKYLLERCKKAIEKEYYLEAIWIVYAMLEDRTTSLLFYCGFVNKKNKGHATQNRNVNKPNHGNLREVIDVLGSKTFGFSKISGKLRAIYKTIEWAESDKSAVNQYYSDLRKRILAFSSLPALKKELELLDIWRKKRNEMIHSAFSKDYSALSFEWKGLAEEGLRGVREIDKLVKHMKREIDLRKKYNIQ